jgi:hypothetical protein
MRLVNIMSRFSLTAPVKSLSPPSPDPSSYYPFLSSELSLSLPFERTFCRYHNSLPVWLAFQVSSLHLVFFF